jgi:hypothetical protein
VKSQRPKDNPVIKFTFKRVNRIFEVDIVRVYLVGDIFLKKSRQILFERLHYPVYLQLIFAHSQHLTLLQRYYIAVLNDLRNRARAQNPGFFKKPGF